MSIETLEKAVTEHHEKTREGLNEIRQRLLELEQKGAGRAPGAGGGGEGGDRAIRDAIEGCVEIKAMANRKTKQAMFSVPAFNLKTILGPVTSGAAALQDPDRAQEIVAPAMQRLTILALLPSLPTNAGATQYTQVATATSGADIQGEDSSPLEKEGAIKGESGFTYDLVTSDVQTIATWIPASSQVLDDMAALERQITTWLRYFLALKAEDEVLTGTGTGLHLEGLQTAATAYNRGATGDTRADTLRKAVTQILLANHAPTGIVLHPTDDEALDLLKDTTGNYLRITVNGNVWNVPRIVSNSQTLGRFLAGDFQAALVRNRQDATVEISNSHDDFFVRNLVAIRAEMRMGLEIHRPAGFVTGTF